MVNDFVRRLNEAFGHASMAEVARRLKVPHATVRNYYQGRLPASDVLIKIANETGISLNWLLIGTGDMYAGDRPPIGLGRFLEERIGEMIDERLQTTGAHVQQLGDIDSFDVEAAVRRLDNPQLIMAEWFRHESREVPQDFGVVFFQGWETFSLADKVAAVRDAKRILDRSLPHLK